MLQLGLVPRNILVLAMSCAMKLDISEMPCTMKLYVSVTPCAMQLDVSALSCTKQLDVSTMSYAMKLGVSAVICAMYLDVSEMPCVCVLNKPRNITIPLRTTPIRDSMLLCLKALMISTSRIKSSSASRVAVSLSTLTATVSGCWPSSLRSSPEI